MNSLFVFVMLAQVPAAQPIAATYLPLTATVLDLNGDQRLDHIALEMLAPTPEGMAPGPFLHGRCRVAVTLAGRAPVYTDLGVLYLLPGSWSLVFADYNGDGQLDFNLGTMAGSNNFSYALYTVLPSGKVQRLAIAPPYQSGLLVADDAQSTTHIENLGAGVISATALDISLPGENRGREVTFQWNLKLRRFDVVGVNPPIEPPE
jgi:hypothetical protein